MTDEATLAWYEREAPRYTASGTQGQSRHLDGFLDRLAPGACERWVGQRAETGTRRVEKNGG